MHQTAKEKLPHARRYTNFEKDICAFEYLTAGNAHYEYISGNACMMTKKTIQRHLKDNTVQISEGIIDVEGLKAYLTRNQFPLAVVLCEDATKITATVEYDYLTDSLRGLVSPLNQNGLPDTHIFKACSAYKIAEDIKNYPQGNHAYVQLALPLAKDAAPYVLYHVCSDNKFESKDVLNRSQYTETKLRNEGIIVVAHASDGDPRLMKAMKARSGLETEPVISPWGPWFRVHNEAHTPFNVQDMIHAVNKFRNKLINSDMQIGKYLFYRTKNKHR